MSEAEALKRNFETFERGLPKLLAEHQGRYAVIAQGQIVEICETYEAAIRYGYSKFPAEDQYYLLQHIVPIPDKADLHLACRAN